MTNEFLRRRTAFIFDKGTLHMQGPQDCRACRDWACEDLHIPDDMWVECVRGYICPGRIQFFTGDNYGPCPYIGKEEVEAVLARYQRRCKGAMLGGIYNGVVKGKEGDTWQPMQQWHTPVNEWHPVDYQP